MDGVRNWFQDRADRFAAWVLRRVHRGRDAESLLGWFIITVWTVLAGMWGGWIVILILLAMTWTLHTIAIESGNHVVLWLTTSALLIVIVIASQTVFGGLPPILLAAAGSTALAHNELVRLNYSRRRGAVVHDAVFTASALSLTAASVVGIIGVTLAEIARGGGERSWLWMPAAVVVLMLIGFGLSIGPARRPSKANAERWQPGVRIPPQPLGHPDHDQF